MNLGLISTNCVNYLKTNDCQIITGLGITCGIGAMAFTAKAAISSVDIIQNHQKSIEEIRAEVSQFESKQDYSKAIIKQYTKTGLQLLKEWSPAILCEAASIACNVTVNQKWQAKYNTLAASALATESVLARLQENIIDKYGIDELRNLKYGLKKEEVDVVKTDENGNEITEKKEVTTISDKAANSIEGYSEYARFFDETCYEWEKNPEYNMTFLKMREADANNKLQRQGHLYLNEVYDMLGIPRSDAGQDVGWVFDANDANLHNYVDFGIINIHKEANRRFVNGYEPVILLDFNVDGNIRQMLYNGK